MPVSDLDIARTAYRLMQHHSDLALAKAQEMVEHLRRKGDPDGADRCAALTPETSRRR